MEARLRRYPPLVFAGEAFAGELAVPAACLAAGSFSTTFQPLHEASLPPLLTTCFLKSAISAELPDFGPGFFFGRGLPSTALPFGALGTDTAFVWSLWFASFGGLVVGDDAKPFDWPSAVKNCSKIDLLLCVVKSRHHRATHSSQNLLRHSE